MASEDESDHESEFQEVWKTEGHPWVDNKLQVTCNLAAPTTQSTAQTVACTGTVVAFGPVDESQRKPALGRVIFEPPPQPPELGSMPEDVFLAMDLTATDIQELQKQTSSTPTNSVVRGEEPNETNAANSEAAKKILQQPLRMSATIPPAALIQNVQERYQTRLEQYLKESILPSLVALAALEEATSQKVHQRITQEDAEEAARHASSSRGGGGDRNHSVSSTKLGKPHPPLYYSKPPNHYLSAPTFADETEEKSSKIISNHGDDEEEAGDPTKEHLSSTPAAWLARIKLGCHQAYNDYLTQQQQEQHLLQLYTSQVMSAAAASSTSGQEVELSSGRRSSSRIARIATEQWEQQKESMDKTRQRQTRSGANSASNGLEMYLKGHRIGSFLKKMQDLERQRLLEVAGKNTKSKKDDEEDESEEEEDAESDEELDEEEEEDVDLYNPYLQPSYGDVLRCLRKLRMEDLQSSLSYWCQEVTDRTNDKARRKVFEEEEEELENVLEVDILPLDKLILGIPEEEEEEAGEEDKMDTELAENEKVATQEDAAVEKVAKEKTEQAAPEATTLPETALSGNEKLPVSAVSAKVLEISSVAERKDAATVAENGEASSAKTEPPAAKINNGDGGEPTIKKEADSKEAGTFEDADTTNKQTPEEVAVMSEQLMLQWVVPSSIEKAPSRKQVHKVLQTQDHTTFGRNKFTLLRKDEEMERLNTEPMASEEPDYDAEEFQRQLEAKARRQEAERAFKDLKAWDKWRFEGIHGGYTVWPKWQDAVKKWQADRNAKQAAAGATATEPDDQIEADHAKALELAQKESEVEGSASAGAGSRRTRRKANAGSGAVFYGQSSQLTAKQLVELILRLCSEKNTAPTILQLQSIVAEDGTQDPIRRLRSALGKLVWRRNQLARLNPSTDWTDKDLFQNVREQALLQIATQDDIAADPGAPGADNSNDETVDAEMKDNNKETSSKSPIDEASLIDYLRYLHGVELQLRKIVMEHLTTIPTAIVATAADEKKMSNEGYDSADFENKSSIEWQTEGHELIGKHILRPKQMENTNDMSVCEWFTVKAFVPSVACEEAESQDAVSSTVKESPLVERRVRFRADPFMEVDTGEVFGEDEYLVLTEAQVAAGMKAAALEQVEIDREDEEDKHHIIEHPFAAGGVSTKITLYSLGNASAEEPLHCTVVGYDSVVGGLETETVHRILILPDAAANKPDPSAIWVSLDVSDETDIRCQLQDSSTKYRIQQSDYHPESAAFAECRNVVAFLENHQKAEAFLQPVDPIALGIPDYFKVIEKPMDISTLSKKLEQGHYSNIPPKKGSGRSPIYKMLNGPFRDDVELIFANAIKYNGEEEPVGQAAKALQRAVDRKINSIANNAEARYQRSGGRQEKRSIYLDEDSDYEFEDDSDDDDFGGRRKRKRSKGPVRPKADDNSTRAMEHPIRLQKTLSETLGLRGPFANFQINSDAASFAFPLTWSCRRKVPGNEDEAEAMEEDEEEVSVVKKTRHEEEFDQLVELQRTIDESEATGWRRSTRAQTHEDNPKRRGKKVKQLDYEYFMLNESEQKFVNSSEELSGSPAPSTRQDIEYLCERLHESHYAELYKKYSASLEQTDLSSLGNVGDETKLGGGIFGSFAGGTFPPYMGRLQPVSLAKHEKFSWQIRSPFLIPALRWVLRGLIQSGHLGEVEPLEQESLNSGVIMANHVYYTDSSLQPFEVLDSKELARRRRANNEEDESSEEEVELSAYEKMRLERVARNQERLKALGLG